MVRNFSADAQAVCGHCYQVVPPYMTRVITKQLLKKTTAQQPKAHTRSDFSLIPDLGKNKDESASKVSSPTQALPQLRLKLKLRLTPELIGSDFIVGGQHSRLTQNQNKPKTAITPHAT